MADLIASSASTARRRGEERGVSAEDGGWEECGGISGYVLEQCSLTGGRLSSEAISVFLMAPASSRLMPSTRSVMYELEAMAEPQPNVLNLTSVILPVASS